MAKGYGYAVGGNLADLGGEADGLSTSEVLRETIPAGIDALAQRLRDLRQISGARCRWLDGWQECGGMKIELLTIGFSS